MISFNEMPNDARIWIYQSNRSLSLSEIEIIKISANEFISEWTSHGKFMKAAVEIFHQQFIVLAVDESAANASGCGIDKSVKFFNQLDSTFNLDLFNRMNVAYYQDEKIHVTSLNEFEQMINSHLINADTLVFNNLINSKHELSNNWLIPVHKSWHSRYLKATI